MTKENIQTAINDWQKWLHLEQWTIRIVDEKPDNEVFILSIKPVEGRYLATLRINDLFYDYKPREQSMYICRELLHTSQQRLQDQIGYLLRNESGFLKTAIDDLYVLEIEYMTDWLSKVLSDVSPIPKSLEEPNA
jgi:hypothetical protein